MLVLVWLKLKAEEDSLCILGSRFTLGVVWSSLGREPQSWPRTVLGAVGTQDRITVRDYQQYMMQTGVERKGLWETTCWTSAGGPGTLTSQSLSGGSFDFTTL